MTRVVYVWAWVPTNLHNRIAAFKQLPGPGRIGGMVPGAPPNRACMLTGYIQPAERMVACPNQDVAYGVGSLDPQTSPVVIQVPDFGDRFWVYELCDQRTEKFAELGAMYGSAPGHYLVVTEDWDGEVPEGITGVLRLPTRIGICIPRVFFADTDEDRDAVQDVLNRIEVYPLGEYDGTERTHDWKTVPDFPAPPSDGGEVRWVKPADFLDRLAELLVDVPSHPGEESLYAQAAELLRAAANNPALRDAILDEASITEEVVIAPLFEFRNYGIPLAGNWTTVDNNAAFGTDYLTRTAIARSNIFTNALRETRYFYLDLDADGARLDGSNEYTVNFAADDLPPALGFWSLTVYNEQHFFEPNPIDRYSIGTKTPVLHRGGDGSLTIRVSLTDPGADVNWLPAPAGAFSLYLRLYWPDDSGIDGSWTPPSAAPTR
ncbi:DUF1214 domain-containing protein [Leifsonia sp. Le1]|uniref:DUF1214 domain-containing protein n=1 Tax=Leifsonia sp. Le1 TaxID=3404918 RepID=UPI003EBA27AD